MEKSKSKKAPRIGVVRPGFHLMWPERWGNVLDRYRCGPGTAIDLSTPLGEEWIKGQEHKVDTDVDPEGRHIATIVHPTALSEMAKYDMEHADAPDEERAGSVGSVIEMNRARAKTVVEQSVAAAADPSKSNEPRATIAGDKGSYLEKERDSKPKKSKGSE